MRLKEDERADVVLVDCAIFGVMNKRERERENSWVRRGRECGWKNLTMEWMTGELGWECRSVTIDSPPLKKVV